MRKAEMKKTAVTFREAYEQRNRIKTINECSWFCLVWGLVLLFFGGYQAACTEGFLNVIYNVVSLIGLLLFIAGMVAPLKLRKAVACVKSVCSSIGKVVLNVILLPVYFAMILINAAKHRKYTARFGFKNWNERNVARSAFFDYHDCVLDKKHSTLHTGIGVLGSFAAHGMYVVIPLVIVLLIIGIVMFFVSSSAVFSFVYTLF